MLVSGTSRPRRCRAGQTSTDDAASGDFQLTCMHAWACLGWAQGPCRQCSWWGPSGPEGAGPAGLVLQVHSAALYFLSSLACGSCP